MNISISEIILIFVIAMLVIKPERMPEAALTLGRLTRSIRKTMMKMKAEINGLVDSVDISHDNKREQP